MLENAGFPQIAEVSLPEYLRTMTVQELIEKITEGSWVSSLDGITLNGFTTVHCPEGICPDIAINIQMQYRRPQAAHHSMEEPHTETVPATVIEVKTDAPTVTTDEDSITPPSAPEAPVPTPEGDPTIPPPASEV
jgi:hypothetical protein